MKTIIFAGPTLSGHPVMASRAFSWRPPAAEGDVYRAALKRPDAIALIDGRFENVPSVWHKEILWALSNGIAVFGAASMGALRAAELHPFGMIGIGAIYEAFRDGRYSDDDEVAVVHAPKEMHYRPLSIAMVDIRASLDAARKAGVVSPVVAGHVLRVAKQTFFKERNWDAILANPALSKMKREIATLRRWLVSHAVAQKRADALLLLDTLRGFRAMPAPPPFEFHSTVFWRALQGRHGG
ncbi:MAG TPA: TfuA-like protein [Rhizomicrobium sp.]